MSSEKIDLDFQNFNSSGYTAVPIANTDFGNEPLFGDPISPQATSQPQQPQQQPAAAAANAANYNFWQIEFYQQFFNIDSYDVGMRLLRSMIPVKLNFIDFIRDNPDLYGPFWIATSLIATMAIASNIGGFLSFDALSKSFTNPQMGINGTDQNPFLKPGALWEYDFQKVSVGSLVIYLYIALVPILLWAFMRYKEIPVSFVHTVCLYGYSMTIFIPIAVVCVVEIELLRWVALGSAGLISGVFIFLNMANEWRAKLPGVQKALLLMLLAYVGILHAALTLFFKFYFFTYNYSDHILILK